jgi:fluoride exporter
LSNFFLVAVGGSIGASSRYVFYLISKNYFSASNLFINTLIINIIGSFLIGYLIFLLENKSFSQDFLKYFFIVGILGSFTTFSTFSLEAVDLLVDKKFLIAFFYIFLSLSLCLLFTFLGLNFNKLIN